MALTYTTLTISTDIDQILNQHQPLIQQAEQDAQNQGNNSILSRARGAARNDLYNEIRRQGIIFTNEEEAAFDHIDQIHETSKTYAKETDNLLKKIEGMKTNDSVKIKAALDTANKMLADVKGFLDEFTGVRRGLTRHQGFRGNIFKGTQKTLCDDLLGAQATKELNNVFTGYREPMIQRSSSINDREVKMKEHAKRIEDCIKTMFNVRRQLEDEAASQGEVLQMLSQLHEDIMEAYDDSKDDTQGSSLGAANRKAQGMIDEIKNKAKGLNPKKVTPQKLKTNLTTAEVYITAVKKKSLPTVAQIIKAWRSQFKTCDKKQTHAFKIASPYQKNKVVKKQLNDIKGAVKQLAVDLKVTQKLYAQVQKDIAKIESKELKAAQKVAV
ncbi:Hypothetical protein PBC10988_24970 [Planctomycetales bacterium 10988]|nr:Hypothetical protein PBC10988_24970 [Planctomycetales bacterium 10988]